MRNAGGSQRRKTHGTCVTGSRVADRYVIEQTDDEVGETYWKVVHGIRLTRMPGFKGDLSDTQAWEVSLSLANADHLPDSIKNSCASPGQQHSESRDAWKGARFDKYWLVKT